MKINLSDLEAKFHPLKRDLFIVAGDGITVGDMLALIRVARAAMVINDSPNFVSLDVLKDLDEALKEIEA